MTDAMSPPSCGIARVPRSSRMALGDNGLAVGAVLKVDRKFATESTSEWPIDLNSSGASSAGEFLDFDDSPIALSYPTNVDSASRFQLGGGHCLNLANRRESSDGSLP